MECRRVYFNKQTCVFHTCSQQCDEKEMTDEEISNLTTIDAVSYTHLDVYKRQYHIFVLTNGLQKYD